MINLYNREVQFEMAFRLLRGKLFLVFVFGVVLTFNFHPICQQLSLLLSYNIVMFSGQRDTEVGQVS